MLVVCGNPRITNAFYFFFWFYGIGVLLSVRGRIVNILKFAIYLNAILVLANPLSVDIKGMFISWGRHPM